MFGKKWTKIEVYFTEEKTVDLMKMVFDDLNNGKIKHIAIDNDRHNHTRKVLIVMFKKEKDLRKFQLKVEEQGLYDAIAVSILK